MRIHIPLSVAVYTLLIACSAEPEKDDRRPFDLTQEVTDNAQHSSSDPTSIQETSDNLLPTDAGTMNDDFIPQKPDAKPREDVCEEIRLMTTRSKVDMMIILDRSGSMGDELRWDPSVAAVRSVTEQLDECIRMGLTLFPDPEAEPIEIFPGFPGFPDACAPGKVEIPIADSNATRISSLLDSAWPEGGTPTSETLQAVLDSFLSNTEPDQDQHPQYVLLVTDGQPTCPNGNGSDITQEDIDSSYLAMEMLTQQGIKGYVIGYDTTGPGRESLASVLDGLAQRGGTGDTQHRPVEDEQSLLSELQSITGAIIECDLILEEEPPGPEYVRVSLGGQQINLNDPNGWEFNPPQRVTLVGTACERIKDCKPNMINVDVLCEPLVVQ